MSLIRHDSHEFRLSFYPVTVHSETCNSSYSLFAEFPERNYSSDSGYYSDSCSDVVATWRPDQSVVEQNGILRTHLIPESEKWHPEKRSSSTTSRERSHSVTQAVAAGNGSSHFPTPASTRENSVASDQDSSSVEEALSTTTVTSVTGTEDASDFTEATDSSDESSQDAGSPSPDLATRKRALVDRLMDSFLAFFASCNRSLSSRQAHCSQF